MRNLWLKRSFLMLLTVAMLMVGATSAFANSGKNQQKDKDKKGNSKHQTEQGAHVNLSFYFSDIKGSDVEWALQYIASLASKKVFQGFEDGTFRPREPITRIQAIKAAVSAMGLGALAETKEEMSVKLNFKDAKNIPDWAVGYVSVALKNDLFSVNDDKVQPDKAADRLWFTTLMVKAMNLDQDARLKMNSKLNFKDADKIPAGSVGYVQTAVDYQLISGYDDKTYRPNQAVTRAEAAKLLALAGEQIDVEQVTKGTLVSNIFNNQITILKDGKHYTYTIHQDSVVPVFRNGVMLTLADLNVGDEIKLQTYTANQQQIVYYVEVTKAANENKEEYTVSGVFNFFGADADGKNIMIIVQKMNNIDMPITYFVNPNVVFKTNGHGFEFGSTTKLTIKNGQVTQIEITKEADRKSVV